MNAIPVGSGAANSADLTIGDTGIASLFVIDANGGGVTQGAQFTVNLKGSNNQYMTIGTLTASQGAMNVQLAPGTVIRLSRVANGVSAGADATGVS